MGKADVAQKMPVEPGQRLAAAACLPFGGESEQAVEATVAADLAVSVRMAGSIPEGMEPITGDNLLPPQER